MNSYVSKTQNFTPGEQHLLAYCMIIRTRGKSCLIFPAEFVVHFTNAYLANICQLFSPDVIDDKTMQEITNSILISHLNKL
jgi:hypothetical protein